jgi:hypothetical protein
MSEPAPRNLAVYVPNRASPHGLAARGLVPGSAIVGRSETTVDTPSPPGWRQVYYEGNLHGAENIITFADRVYHAADRLVHGHPTTTRAIVPAVALATVGTFDYRTRTLSLSDQAALAAWLGFDDARVPWHELRPSR